MPSSSSVSNSFTKTLPWKGFSGNMSPDFPGKMMPENSARQGTVSPQGENLCFYYILFPKRREPGEYSENVKDTKQNCKMTAGGVCAIMWKKKKDLIFPVFQHFVPKIRYLQIKRLCYTS